MRRVLAIAGLAAAALVWIPGGIAAGQGFVPESTPSFDVRIVIEPSGALAITETIVQDFGDTPRHGIFRYIPNRVRYDDRYDRVYPIDLVSVTTSPNTPDDVETSEENGNFVIRIGDPDTTITGEHTYTIVYRVEGAMNGFETHDELYWNAVSDQWEQPIGQMHVRVAGPAPVTRVACFQGPFGSTLGCTKAQIKDGVAVFAQDDLGAFVAMSVVVALPPGTVASTAPILEERWSPGRAFAATPFTVGGSVVLLVALVAGFSLLVWRRGRDLRYQGSPIDQVMGAPPGAGTQSVPLFEAGAGPVEFAPPENLRPGEVGTLIDEEANTLDVTATIVDLAVRKFLVIEEIPKTLVPRQAGLEVHPAVEGPRGAPAVRAQAAGRAVRGRDRGGALGAAEEVRRAPGQGEVRAVPRRRPEGVVLPAAGQGAADVGGDRRRGGRRWPSG